MSRRVSDVKIKTVNQAASDHVGTSIIYESPAYAISEHSSQYQEAFTRSGSSPVEKEIKLTTIDDYLSDQGIGFVHFLKIDTEGHELFVLRGARESLHQGKIGIIQFEFNEMNLYSHMTMRDIRKILSEYSFWRPSPNGLIFLPDLPLYQEIYQFSNIICLPRSK